ncbi:golgi-body localization protein domain-containing protein [Pisolithus thermaeus]|nr:golgi-body localization protein domain-containing protein [Pisolithus thermaeus]
MPSSQLVSGQSKLVLGGLAVASCALLCPPHPYFWISLFAWCLGLVAFLFFVRAHLAPFVLTRFSNHIRVRSISLRSIRGLYFRKGNRTWHIDRFAYAYSPSRDGTSKGLCFRIEGFKLEIDAIKTPQSNPRSKHRRGLALTDFSPSPLALYIWSIISSLYSLFDPIIRPMSRLIVTFILRQFILLIPRLTETLQLDIDRVIVSVNSMPEICVSAENVVLKGHVSFTQTSQGRRVEERHQSEGGYQTLNPRALAMGAWKSRLVNNLQRTWTRTWDHTLGSTTGSMAFDLVVGGIESSGLEREPLVCFSGPTFIAGSACFSPRTGAIEPSSFQSHIKVGGTQVNADAVQATLSTLPVSQTEEAPCSSGSATTLVSPWVRTPFSAMSVNSEYVGSRVEKREKQTPLPVELVRSVEISLGSLTVSKILGGGHFQLVVRGSSCSLEPSDSATRSAHHVWLGKRSRSSTAYHSSLTMQDISLFRMEAVTRRRGEGPILFVGSTIMHCSIADWPALTPVDPLLRGGATACVLLDVEIASLSLADKLDLLMQLKGAGPSEDVPQWDVQPLLPAILSPVPQVVFGFAVGPISARMEGVGQSKEPVVVELDTNGIILNVTSTFYMGPSVVAHRGGHDVTREHVPLRMSIPLHCVLHPLFLRLPCKSTKSAGKRMSRWGSESTLSDTVFSLETIEVNGTFTALGELQNEDQSIMARLNTRSFFATLHCRTEAMLLELWHPKRLEILSTLLSSLSSSRLTTRSSRRPPMLPTGYSLSLAVARAVLFVTGPDIDPTADETLTLGVAFSTGVFSQLCSVGADHVHSVTYSRSELHDRQKLFLPPNKLGEAIFSARASNPSTGGVAFGKLMLWNTNLRSAAADQFSMDDPLILERDNKILDAKRIMSIQNFSIDMKCTVLPSSPIPTGCDGSFTIDSFTLFFDLSLVHSASGALWTLEHLKQCAGVSSSPEHISTRVTLNGTMKVFRARLSLLDQKVVARANHIDISSGLHGNQVHIDSLFLWVPVVASKTRAINATSWEELGRMYRCTLSSQKSLPHRVNIATDSLRVRIPYGYVLAELSQATVITVKAARHLMQMMATGRYIPMSAPVAEDAKHVPNIAFTCRMLCLEAADDPFESQLGFNYRVGIEAARSRLRREEAFDAKASAVVSGISAPPDPQSLHSDYRFDGNHSVTLQEARCRLDMAHSMDWMLRHRRQSRERFIQEDSVFQLLQGSVPLKRPTKIPDLVRPADEERVPPLFRIIIFSLHLHVNEPSFPPQHLHNFLHEQGNGVPHQASYSLLVPMHLTLALASLQVSLRDYPLPLLYIPPLSAGDDSNTFLFDSDLVIAEELGPESSVEWVPCPFYDPNEHPSHSTELLLKVPKTLMPVKTYAQPSIQVSACGPTAFAWGVSYNPVLQDVVRVLESLTPEARDPSPPLGFWDKLRLVFHWKIQVWFKEEVRLYLKGSRNPHVLENEGSGFAFCWQGKPRINIGFENDVQEIVQVNSDAMLIVIPRFDSPRITALTQGRLVSRSDYVKVCAKLSSGVRFGVGTVFERTCGSECRTCTGSTFDRLCREFTFRPHYDIQLMRGSDATAAEACRDSYEKFRSDFVHLSISLASGLRHSEAAPLPSSLHLTPKAFTHFWSWWGLFDDLAVPIRQGSYYPQKQMSPKFSRHLATIKYRISLPQVFITHTYLDDTKESWVDGTTCFVGMKAKVDLLQADLHQREQETIAPGKIPDSIQVVRHKPFYAAEVIMKDLDVRVLQATFSEPLKQAVHVSPGSENSSKKVLSSSSEMPSSWMDKDDFVETDWFPQHQPRVHLLPVLSCPKLTYFKRHSQHTEIQAENSKFGNEDTHVCLLGCEPSVPQVEISLAEARVSLLQEEMRSTESIEKHRALDRMITLLGEYIAHIREMDQLSEAAFSNLSNYYMPSDLISASEWADFENVYQVHAPSLFMSNPVRDLLIQYYNCSRARRGFEYHMATRAVKFIRDQADTLIPRPGDQNTDRMKTPVNAAQAAASALRRILTKERGSTSLDIQSGVPPSPLEVNPMDGWDDGVILRKSHFCLLLKPQIILLSTEIGEASTVVLAAVQAKLQSFKIMDASNLEDPVSGTIITRNYVSLDGLQAFCPSLANLHSEGPVPLEVLIDYRCESDAFDRMVPQTNATGHYDRFNRLRLRTNITPTNRVYRERSSNSRHAHLYDETDLVEVRVPQFTVSADARHFQFISDIITNLVLFSDVAHKARLEKLETLLFAYDFTDLRSAAKVVTGLQNRLRSAIDTYNDVVRQLQGHRSEPKLEILKLQAHMHQLADELSLIFDAIRLAQSHADDNTDQKSALLLRASSSEISWRMIDEHRELLAKLALQNIDFTWLSKQDSSTVSRLTVCDLQAFDGSPHAIWTEIVSKYEEPSNHLLTKRDLFLDANWIILAPVGGITIYEKFQVDFHPIRLQLDASLGQRIMEYIWPSRRGRHKKTTHDSHQANDEVSLNQSTTRPSFESSRLLQKPRTSLDSGGLPPWKKLGGSRSFTDLRSAATESAHSLHRVHELESDPQKDIRREPLKDDAVEMKSRLSQKTFVLVKISSFELLLSIMKAESFECRDARIRTHALEFRNQTWSFEELVDQFIPSDLTWKGWVRMAFQQPLIPVLPVARELFSKTKLIASKGATRQDSRSSSNVNSASGSRGDARDDTIRDERLRRPSSSAPAEGFEASTISVIGPPVSEEGEAITEQTTAAIPRDPGSNSARGRKRLLSVFSRSKSAARGSPLRSKADRHSCDEPSGSPTTPGS